MPSSTVNICVLTLVLLSFQHTCHSKPHGHNKREINKDYSNPAIFSPQEFEKGGDGKYYLKKNFHRMDSEVRYAEDENTDDKNENNPEAVAVETKATQVAELKNEPFKEMATDSDVAHRRPTSADTEKVKVEYSKKIPHSKSEIALEELSGKVEYSKDKAPFAPIDTKFLVPPKPDSKDEIATKTDLPPISEEEKVKEKVAIGQVPHVYPRIIPVPNNFRLPILIPVHQVSYGSVSVLPFPPVAASDRLPLPFGDDEIVGEDGPETASVEYDGTEQKEPGLPLGDPYVPALPFSPTFLKDLKDAAAKQDSEKQSKVVDVLGKKFLMQSNVIKFPRGDNGDSYVRFMSVRPFESPKTPKEDTAEETTEGNIQEAKRKEIEEFDSKKTNIREKEDGLLKTEKKLVEEQMKKEKATAKEILKAEETQIKLKVEPRVESINPESGFKTYEDPYVKGIKDMISASKKHSFVKEMIPIEESSEEAVKKILNEELESRLNGEERKHFGRDKSLEGDKVMFEKDIKKKNENVDTVSEEEVLTDARMDGKEEFFFLENKKKEAAAEEESLKPRKKLKKKCKCEEKDSDSEDD